MKNICTELVLAHYHLGPESVVTVVHGFPLSEHSGLVSLFSQFMAGQGWRERASVHQSWL